MIQQPRYQHEDRSYILGMMEQEDGRSLRLSDIHNLLIINSKRACLYNCNMRHINPSLMPITCHWLSYQPCLRILALNHESGADLVSFS